MFHAAGNLFFGRTPLGSVRIVKFASPPREWPSVNDPEHAAALLDVVLPAELWASTVASVSAGGETAGRYAQALRFHTG